MKNLAFALLFFSSCNFSLRAQIDVALVIKDSISIDYMRSPQGLCWDGKNFWIVDDSTFTLYKLSYSTGKVDTSFFLKQGTSYQGVVFDGKQLAVIDDLNKELQKIDSNDGKLLQKYKLPSWSSGQGGIITDVTWNGANYFVIVQAGWTSQIAKVDLDKNLLDFFVYTTGVPTGLTYEDNTFYYCKNTSSGITSIKAGLSETNYQLPNALKYPSAVAIVSAYFWVIDCEHKKLYKLKENYTSIYDEQKEISGETMLLQNHPNPFNPVTRININMAEKKNVEIGVFDMLGRETSILHKGILEKGIHAFLFDGGSIASGTYLVRMITGEKILTQKIVLMK